MNDPDWTRGIQETAKALQHDKVDVKKPEKIEDKKSKRRKGKKSKRKVDALVR